MILMIGLQNLMKHNTKNFQVILTSTLSNIKKIGLILTFTIIHFLRELNLRLQKSEHNISTLIINQKVTGLTFQVHNFSEYNLKLIHAQQNLIHYVVLWLMKASVKIILLLFQVEMSLLLGLCQALLFSVEDFTINQDSVEHLLKFINLIALKLLKKPKL